ncbi:MAG: helix-turn-helix transcriptional regulator [Pseudoxanthomonas mexicana]|uniref:helix-turn-helix domain-containing protein n=1 Tax=Pseudoxanthomonas mexicana TaxID=128785 RepID=UPI0009FAD878|nr:helix-turn-helix transcriptional regulator [Pseudoxanthomonas mexicana]MBL8255919.1 helix-turn-helix transcriptional regulator [Pseudoxanthomonas mexicana]
MTTSLPQKVGLAVRDLRKELGLSQDAFADSIQMHRAYYSSIERGERNLTLSTFSRVANGLAADMSAILKRAGL